MLGARSGEVVNVRFEPVGVTNVCMTTVWQSDGKFHSDPGDGMPTTQLLPPASGKQLLDNLRLLARSRARYCVEFEGKPTGIDNNVKRVVGQTMYQWTRAIIKPYFYHLSGKDPFVVPHAQMFIDLNGPI